MNAQRISVRLVALVVLLLSGVHAQSSSNDVPVSAPRADTTVSDAAQTHGALTIRTSPSGALVIVDGMPVGESPVKVDSLLAGKHRLQIAKEGYFTRSATVLVRGGINQEATFELTAPASLTVLANQPGAQVALNGKRVGRVPYMANDLRAGRYAVRVSADTLSAFDTTIHIEAGDVDTVRAVLVVAAPDTVADNSPSRSPRDKKLSRRVATVVALTLFSVFALVILIADSRGS